MVCACPSCSGQDRHVEFRISSAQFLTFEFSRNNSGLKRKEAASDLSLTSYSTWKGTDADPLFHGQVWAYQELLQAPEDLTAAGNQGQLPVAVQVQSISQGLPRHSRHTAVTPQELVREMPPALSPALLLATHERSWSLAISQRVCMPHKPLAAILTQRLTKQQDASQQQAFNTVLKPSVQLRPTVLKIMLQCRAVSGCGGGTAKD